MTIIDIFKINNRKNGKLTKFGRDKINGKEERYKINKKYLNAKKSDFGNQSGLNYRLPKNEQHTIKSIIDILEKENQSFYSPKQSRMK